ncbi:MAG: outer membrane beta-barrel protein [Ectothiorhodospiraceae bacterium]|nr:outer membrane beta-barrel protein [Ectothiorhodospiraceae bacterium]
MMKRLLPIALIGTGLVSLPQTGWTQQSPWAGPPQGYIGGGVGYYRLNDEDFLDEDERFKDDRWSWKVFAGVQFNRVLSAELGYTDFGKTSRGPFSADASGWSLAGTAALPVTPNFAPYAKLGQLFWDADLEAGPVSTSRDGNDMFYGVGARFALSHNLDLRMEYERFALDDTDLDMGSLNLQLRF